MNPVDVSEKALRWRCRRGMQELDVMLLRYLDQDFPNADAASRQAFANLLQQQDDLLWDWLTGRAQCSDESLNTLLQVIKRA